MGNLRRHIAFRPDLTEEERREIELAENLDRKDLTEIELSLRMLTRAKATADVLRGGANNSIIMMMELFAMGQNPVRIRSRRWRRRWACRSQR